MDADERVLFNLRRSARAQGYKFIELRLKDTYKHETMDAVKVHGVHVIKGTPGTLRQGRQSFNLFIKRDSVLSFKFDEDTGYFTAWLVIDEEPAKFAEKSHNLDILVGHLNNPIWEIVKDGDKALVMQRYPAFKKYQADYQAEIIRKRAVDKRKRDEDEQENLDAQEEALASQLEEVRLNKEKIKAKNEAILNLAKPKVVHKKAPIGKKKVNTEPETAEA